jgi:hypothetical protein
VQTARQSFSLETGVEAYRKIYSSLEEHGVSVRTDGKRANRHRL